MFTKFTVRILHRSTRLSRNFTKWGAWSGEFFADISKDIDNKKRSSGWTLEEVREHIKLYFSCPCYKELRFGIFGCVPSQRVLDKTERVIIYNNWELLEIIS